jgi:hypothetical protein
VVAANRKLSLSPVIVQFFLRKPMFVQGLGLCFVSSINLNNIDPKDVKGQMIKTQILFIAFRNVSKR